jgi:hypothetical protein
MKVMDFSIPTWNVRMRYRVLPIAIKKAALFRTAYLLSGRQDSNLRPLAPHTSALPGCATTRTFKCATPALRRDATRILIPNGAIYRAANVIQNRDSWK